MDRGADGSHHPRHEEAVSDQLSLFPADSPSAVGRDAGADRRALGERHERLAPLARVLPDTLRMVTISWSVPGWRGLV